MPSAKKLLIVSNRADMTTDLVVRRLRERGIGYVRFNTEVFPVQSLGTLSIGDSSSYITLKTSKDEIQSDQIRGIWYRRPTKADWDGISLSEEEKEFASRETASFLRNTWALLVDAFWVNDPFNSARAEQKAFQLETARNVGLRIPETLFSNDADEVLEFAERHQDKVIVKPISHGSIAGPEEKLIFTKDLQGRSDKIDVEEIRISPLIVQQKIEKRVDVRLTVFGQRFFAYEVLAGERSKTSFVDWREYRPEELAYIRCEPPIQVLEAIHLFMGKLGISYGAFDFSIDTDGDWIFLEVNPSGQFAWLEIATGDTLIDALIDLLCGVKI